MCQECPEIDPSEADMQSELYRLLIQHDIETLNEVSNKFVLFEDEYRLIGFFYHTTKWDTRETMANDPELADRLVHLEDYFELEDPSQYDLWANKIVTGIEKASTLRADLQHIPQQATLAHKVHQFEQVIHPAVRKLVDTMHVERIILMQLATEVNILRKICMDAEVDLDQENKIPPWWVYVWKGEDGEAVVDTEGKEWDAFLNWLYCLPEVRKAMEKGEKIENIAACWIDGEADQRPDRLLYFQDGKIC